MQVDLTATAQAMGVPAEALQAAELFACAGAIQAREHGARDPGAGREAA